jgi:YD repeat-containing protein
VEKKKVQHMLAVLAASIFAIGMSSTQAVPTVLADTSETSTQQNQQQSGLPLILPNPFSSTDDATANLGQANPPKDPPILLPYGELLLNQTDFTLNSYALPISMTRMYRSGLRSTLSPFGYGWIFPYQQYIQMYADFNIAQFLPDGTHTSYTFHKSDPNLYLNEYDGDPLIYYPLDKGSYTADGFAVTKLQRTSRYDYEVTQPDGTVLTFYGYNIRYQKTDKKRGKLIAIKDRYGNTVHLSYDSQGNLKQIADISGRTVKFTYNGSLISSMIDPLGQTTYYSYSGDLLTKVTHPDKTTDTYAYDNEHRLTSATNSKTGLEQYVYNGDRVTQINDNGNLLYRFDYNDAARQIVRTDALGYTSHYTYDENNNFTHIVDAVGDVFNVTYTTSGQISSIDGPLGITTYTYDQNQNLISQKGPYTNGINSAYDMNQPSSEIQYPQGQTWPLNYNNLGDTITILDPSLNSEGSTYDGRGLPASYTDQNGDTTQFSYDSYGQLKTATDNAGQKYGYTYDKDGRLIRTDSPNGVWWTYRYGAGNQLLEIKNSLRSKDTFAYNTRGLLTSEKENGAVTQFQYDMGGHLIEKKESDGTVTKYEYNLLGQIAKVTEITEAATGPLKDETDYTWDGLGRLASESGTSIPSISYQYDSLGNITQEVTPDGTYTYTRDSNGNVMDTYLNGKLIEHDTYD